MKRQPIVRLLRTLDGLPDKDRGLLSLADLRGVLPESSPGAFKTMLCRAEKSGTIQRICRGLYLHPGAGPDDGLLLFHAAARLRASQFNYISLETALSDAGLISQVPMNWITIMSSGRRNTIRCGQRGTIEFVHTSRKPAELAGELTYDSRCRMWRASVTLARRDMRATRRSMDLVAGEPTHEPV